MGRTSAALIALLLCASATRSQTEPAYAELPNFHQVNRQLYRGAQPRDGGIRKLAQLGIKTIINLRGEDEKTRAQKTEAETLGLLYFSVPLPGLSRPTTAKVEGVLALINATANQPVFVHCHHGEDRTGVIVAIYRITRDGWTSAAAKTEAKRYGMSRVQIGMKDFISDYHRDWKKPRPEAGAAPRP